MKSIVISCFEDLNQAEIKTERDRDRKRERERERERERYLN